MTDKNKKAYERLNILKWHEAGYTGKGVHVAILGYEPGTWHNGASIIKEVAPSCEISEINVMKSGVSWEAALAQCLEMRADVVCCSLRKGSWNKELEDFSRRLREQGCIMIDSADNEGGEIDAYPALDPSWIAIGAYDERENGLAGYSNYGEKMLCLCYTNLDAINAKGNYIGLPHTSGAVQVPAGIAALLKEHSNISPKDFEEFVAKHAMNLEELGKDKKTGYGLICMPAKIPGAYDTEIKLTIGSAIAIVNGKDVLLDSPAFIRGNRTFLPARFVAEAFGCRVDWDPERQEVTIQR